MSLVLVGTSVRASALQTAAADAVGAELWHSDRHFELIATVTGQPVRRFHARS